jgi:excalibur calcium-binding domain-containing protein
VEGWRFNPPRSWPVEAGFEPERGWRPPPEWAALPPGHRLWLPEHPQPGRRAPSVLALLGVAGLVAAAILVPPVSGNDRDLVAWSRPAKAAPAPAASAPKAGLTSSGPGKGSKRPAVRRYSGCAELREVYPHGVGRRTAHDRVGRAGGPKVTAFTRDAKAYAANTARDGDGDGIACERP